MKRFRLSYLLILPALMMLASCQSEDEVNEVKSGGEPVLKEGYAQVKLHISPAGSDNNANARTRDGWRDPIAKDEEMMNIWTVVIVNDATDVVEQIISCKPTGSYTAGKDDDREVDPIATLPLGTYRFYSFANIGGTKLETLLNLPTGSVPTPSSDEIVSNAVGDTPATGGGPISDLGHVYKSNNNPNQATADVDINAAVSGNKFANFDTTDDNGFGSYGIPMSNVQTATITSSTTLDLIVVRMLAKIELRFYNVTGKDINIKKITFKDVTKNPTGTETNLKLLPNLTANNTMEYSHGDIQTNLNTSYTQREDIVFTYTTPELLKVNKEYSVLTDPKLASETGKYTSVSFYVNESAAPTDNGLNGGLFNVELELDNDDYRYALISSGENSGITIDANGNVTYDTKRADNWTYIARNDYRVIPIVLDGYRLEMIPYDFPEIGVYPASVYVTNPSARISQQIYQMDFHDYGHFHLLPTVKRYYAEGSTDKTDEVAFSATSGGSGTYWTLYGAGTTAAAADWTNSFKSYTDATAAIVYNTAVNKGLASDADPTSDAATYSKTSNFFYGQPGSTGLPENNIYPTSLPVYPTAVDYSENGDWPVFYNNDGATKWKPKATDEYRPYIFGQIAPQESEADKKVFHEFKVNLYVNGATTPRILTYRFYMHLKQDHATARRRSASRCH